MIPLLPSIRSAEAVLAIVLVLTLCSMESVGMPSSDIGDPYGICVHIHTWEHPWAAKEVAIWKEMGIRKYRSGMPWQDVQTPDGVWVWENAFDKTSRLMAQHPEFKMTNVFGGVVPGGDPLSKKNLDGLLNYIKEELDRDAGETFGAFQVLNETNINGLSADEYAEIFHAVAKMLHQRFPDVPVVAAGTSGVPLDYIEQEFQAGLVEDMDVFAVHPYGWNIPPENWIPSQARLVRNLMDKYGAEDKPLWFTEIGYSSEDLTDFPVRVYPRLMKELGLKPENTRVYVIFDTEYNLYSETHIFDVRKMIPGVSEIIPIDLRDLAHLMPGENDLLVIPESQCFPGVHVKDLRTFLARGGKVFSPQGFPLYFELNKEPDGLVMMTQVNGKWLSELHLGWEAPWTKDECQVTQNWEWANPDETTPLPEKYLAYMFFNGANLRGNDRFTPVLYGINGNYKGAVAGVYHFSSDLKGKFAVAGCSMRGCSEEYQAYLNTRTLILAIASQVEEIYIHHFRAVEGERFDVEHHFGINHSNLDPKPANCALRTLIQELPAHSTRPVISRVDDAFLADWTRPDGQKVTAVWRASIRTMPMTFASKGSVTARECTGIKIPVNQKGGMLSLCVGPGVTYIHHNGDLKVIK